MRTFIVIVILLLLLVAAGVASVLSFHFSSPRDIRVGETVSETPLEFRNGHLVPVPNHDGSNVQVRPSGVVVENIPQRSHVRMGFTFFPLLGIGVVFVLLLLLLVLVFSRGKSRPVDSEESELLRQIWEGQDRMEERITHLETILLERHK